MRRALSMLLATCGQTTNLYSKYPEIAAQMDARLKEILR